MTTNHTSPEMSPPSLCCDAKNARIAELERQLAEARAKLDSYAKVGGAAGIVLNAQEQNIATERAARAPQPEKEGKPA